MESEDIMLDREHEGLFLFSASCIDRTRETYRQSGGGIPTIRGSLH